MRGDAKLAHTDFLRLFKDPQKPWWTDLQPYSGALGGMDKKSLGSGCTLVLPKVRKGGCREELVHQVNIQAKEKSHSGVTKSQIKYQQFNVSGLSWEISCSVKH